MPRAAPGKLVDTPAVISENGTVWSKAEVLGRRVYQRDDLINPNAVDARGRTNIERMERGLAPVGPDGRPVELHHMTQQENIGFNGQKGSLAEVPSSFHQQNYDTIHIYPRNDPDYMSWRRTNPDAALQYDTYRRDY